MEQTRQNLEAQVLERAAKDSQFREQLKQDPRGTIARDFAVEVPRYITVEVVEETPTQVYLVLPSVLEPAQELSDQELEAVAGGLAKDTDPPQPTFCFDTCDAACSDPGQPAP